MDFDISTSVQWMRLTYKQKPHEHVESTFVWIRFLFVVLFEIMFKFNFIPDADDKVEISPDQKDEAGLLKYILVQKKSN